MGEHFHAEVDGGFQVKIEKYSFYVCTAIHDGHNLREDLRDNCLLDESERLYEEDPYTGALIEDTGIMELPRIAWIFLSLHAIRLK